jgi:uncharacterized membrane protein
MTPTDKLLIAPVVIAVLALPLVFGWVPPNPLYGFRTPRTLADRDLWYRVNFFCGCAVLIASGLSVILLLVLPPSPYAVLEFALPLVAALVASSAYLRGAA